MPCSSFQLNSKPNWFAALWGGRWASIDFTHVSVHGHHDGKSSHGVRITCLKERDEEQGARPLVGRKSSIFAVYTWTPGPLQCFSLQAAAIDQRLQ